MECIIAEDRDLQRYLLDINKYLMSQKSRILSNQQMASLSEKKDRIDELEKEKKEAINSIDAIIHLLVRKPFYLWLDDLVKEKISEMHKDNYSKRIRLADYIYVVKTLEKLNTSHFSKKTFYNLTREYKDFKHMDPIDLWGGDVDLTLAKNYLDLIHILIFIAEQYAYMYLTILNHYGDDIDGIKKSKSDEEESMSQLQKEIKKEIKDHLEKDLSDLIKTLKEKGNLFVEQLMLHK